MAPRKQPYNSHCHDISRRSCWCRFGRQVLRGPGETSRDCATFGPELSGKRLELLKETNPKFSRVAVLWNPEYPGLALAFKESQAAAGALGFQLQSLDVLGPKDFESAFKAAAEGHTGALVRTDVPVL